MEWTKKQHTSYSASITSKELANLLDITQENAVILILQLALTLVKMQLADLKLHWL